MAERTRAIMRTFYVIETEGSAERDRPKACRVLNRASVIRFAKVFYGSAHAFLRGGATRSKSSIS